MGFVTVPPSPFPPSSGKTGDIAERVTELETNVSTLQSTKAPKTDIAPAFSAETNYSVGDLVYYDGALYECTTEHTVGAWNSEHFTDTAINSNLTNKATIIEASYIPPQYSFEIELVGGCMYAITCARSGVPDFAIVYVESNNMSVTHLNTSGDLTYVTSGRSLTIRNSSSVNYRLSILKIFG